MLKRVKLLVLEVNTLISQIMLGLIYPIVFFFSRFYRHFYCRRQVAVIFLISLSLLFFIELLLIIINLEESIVCKLH